MVKADINVTPLIDVLLVLLIIFMVATPIIVTAPVPLPAAAHPTEHKGETLDVVVRADGGVTIAGTPFPDSASLAGYLAARASATRSLLILIQSDRDVAYRDLESVLTACRTSGASEIALATELRPAS